MPTEFKGGWEQYAEDYCFIQNTFFIPFEEEIPNGDSERAKVGEESDKNSKTNVILQAEIGYYQWVPIVLALQAIMFYIPSWLWTTLHKFSGQYRFSVGSLSNGIILSFAICSLLPSFPLLI